MAVPMMIVMSTSAAGLIFLKDLFEYNLVSCYNSYIFLYFRLTL